MEKLNLAEVNAMFASVSALMARHADELCEMDARMGDGDLGLTMKKGFSALSQYLEEDTQSDLGTHLTRCGLKMASTVPSTMGTLMASGVMGGGKAIMGKTELSAADFAAYLEGFTAGIIKRGKCKPGDRTVLDAVAPAAQAARDQISRNPDATLREVALAAAQAAQAGAEETRSMTPRYGKAAAFAQRAAGIMDQGAYAGSLMIQGYLQYLETMQ